MRFSRLLFLIVLSFNALSVELKNLNIDTRIKKQLQDSFKLKQILNQRATNQSSGTFVTIGGDGACDVINGASSIQSVIDNGATEIRLTINFNHLANLIINDVSLIIRGGYANCSDAQNNIQSGQTTLSGVNAITSPVISILGNTQRNTIVLDSLFITAGDGSGSFPGGGLSTSLANAQIDINNVNIEMNLGDKGAGIAIIDGDTDIFANDLLVKNNIAINGGGIYCDGSVASITLDKSSGLYANEATRFQGGDGGGLYLTNGCSFGMFSGTTGGASDYRGIVNNLSAHKGGGIYADNGSIATLFGHELCFFGSCFGDNSNPVNLTSNRSDSTDLGFGSGGGAFLLGANTQLAIYAGLVADNKGGDLFVGDGGGINLRFGANLTVERFQKNCWSNTHCNYFNNNTSGRDGGYGGAILNDGSTVNINNAVFANNRADEGTVIYSNNGNTTVRGSIFHHNGNNGLGDFDDNSVFKIGAMAEIDVYFSTIVDNNAELAVFAIDPQSAGVSAIVGTIVHDASTGPVFAADPGASLTDCTILHENTSTPSQMFSIVTDPEFIDRANNDYHLDAAISPALDVCFSNKVDNLDMDFEPQGWDDPTIDNTLGPFDIGADETYTNDVIFKNDFN